MSKETRINVEITVKASTNLAEMVAPDFADLETVEYDDPEATDDQPLPDWEISYRDMNDPCVSEA